MKKKGKPQQPSGKKGETVADQALNRSKKEKSPKKKKTPKPKKVKAPRTPKVKAEGGNSQGKLKVVLFAILAIAILGAGCFFAYNYFMSPQTPMMNPAASVTENPTAPPAIPIPPQKSSGRSKTSKITPGQKPVKPAGTTVAPKPTATPKPVVKAAAKKPVPSTPAAKKPVASKKNPATNKKPAAVRNPIVVRTPPAKKPPKVAKKSTVSTPRKPKAPPAKPVVAKKSSPPKPATGALPATKVWSAQPNPAIPASPGSKTLIDVSDPVFAKQTSSDDLFYWPGGQSQGTSKTYFEDAPDLNTAPTISTGKNEFKSEKTFYMVLVKESDNPDDLEILSRKLNQNNPAPEIKKTTSFGRDIYWLTVGHYTVEFKAFNKAQEIRSLGYPTTIVSEKVHY